MSDVVLLVISDLKSHYGRIFIPPAERWNEKVCNKKYLG